MRRGRVVVDRLMVLRTRALARPAPPGRLDHERVLPGPPPPVSLADAVARWAPDASEPPFRRASRLARGLAEAGGGPG